MKDIIIHGDVLEVLKTLEPESVNTCVTSPPYFGLRDYGKEGQIGLEETPELFVGKLVEVFREVRRVLRDDGTLWLNLGDSYNGNKQGNTETNKNKTRVTDSFKKTLWKELKQKDLIGIPWRVAFALQADGWYLRQDIIWHKPNPMPESVTDRCTKAHEYIFLLTKSKDYYFDNEAIKEPCVNTPEQQVAKRNKRPHKGQSDNGMRETTGGFDKISKTYEGRNKRSVWTVTTKPYKGAHFATFPTDLIEPCVLAGAPKGGIVLDPFFGSGTTGAVAAKHGRHYIGIELNEEYIKLAQERLSTVQPLLV